MPRTFRVNSPDPDDSLLRAAAEMLRDGLVVAFPTDTVYGLAVDPRNRTAVQRLFTLKARVETNALPLIAADIEHAARAVSFTDAERRLAERWWPGPLTIVAQARSGLAAEAMAGGRTAGVRVPDHAVARALAKSFGFPITATSANRSGAAPASTADEVVHALPHVDGVVDGGPTRGGPPSTIVALDSKGPRLIREGAIAWDRVLESLE